MPAPLAEMVRMSDLLIVIGERRGKASTTKCGLIDLRAAAAARRRHPGAEELGMVDAPAIAASPRDFAAALPCLAAELRACV